MIRKSHCFHIGLLFCFVLPVIFPGLCRSGWIIEVVDDSNEVRESCSLALDSTGRPHIAYQSEVDRGLFFARRADTGWVTERIHLWSSLGYDCSLAFNHDDLPAIAHRQDSTDDVLKYSAYDGIEWTLETVDDTASVGGSASLVFDISNRPHIGYTNFSINDLRYAYKYAGSWTIQELGVPGYAADLVLSPAGGYAHLCSMWPVTYQHSYLYYTSNVPPGWDSDLLLDTGGPGVSAKIVLNEDGNPVIAHRDSYIGSLYLHTYLSDGYWIPEVIDPGIYIDGALDMVIDSMGHLHLSYYDGALGHLKYATRTDSSWQIQTVDTDGVLGVENSIAVDDSGIPHIAYIDSGRKQLRYATLDPGPPWFDLDMPDTSLSSGDIFELIVRGGNTTSSQIIADEYIVLDIFGSMFFYPGWSPDLDYMSITMEPMSEYQKVPVTFVWPEGVGAGSGLYFHGALFNSGTFDLIAMDSVEWSYS